MKTKIVISACSAIMAIALFLGTSAFSNKTTDDKKFATSWFLYMGPNQTPAELAKQTNYVKTSGTPSCTTGADRCAILANVETVGGIDRPEDDASHKVIFTQEKKEN